MNNINNNWNDISQNVYNHKFVGFVDKKLINLNEINNARLLENKGFCFSIKELLSENECKNMINFFNSNKIVEVGNENVKLEYGSYSGGIERSSYYDKDFAIKLSKRLGFFLVEKETYKGEIYELIGLNPLIRFICYKEGHKLVPHYDGSVEINKEKNIRTIKTIVIYLNDVNSGYTNIFDDNQNIIYKQKPSCGLCLVFDHDILHESEKINLNERKIIITTEVCYRKIIK